MQRVVITAATLLALSVALSDVSADQVDQACEDPGLHPGTRQIDFYEPTGQSFIPSERTHVGVELRIGDCNPTSGPPEVSVVLREGTIGGSAVSGTDVTETYSGHGWVYFGFAAPVDLTPGQTYVIDVSAPSARGCLYHNDEGCYADGSAWISGSEVPIDDYLFRTLVPTILYPTDDAFISMEEPNTNWASSNLSVRNRYGAGGSDYWERNSLVKFDLSSIPPGSTIISATLNLYYFDCIFSNCSSRDLTCRRITGSWDEDTVTWNTRPDVAAEVTDQATVPSTFDWMDWDVTSDVQAVVDEEEDSEGWQLSDEVTWGDSNIPDERFYSKEYGDYVPYLEIIFEPPPACEVSPTSLDFGTVVLGDDGDATFTITNTGGGVLSGSVSESCNHYSIFSGGGPYNLGRGESVVVTVRFEPSSVGQHNCTVETGNGLCSDVSCSGEGWQVGEDLPTVSEWGLVAMTLVVLAAGTFVLMRRRVASGG